MQGASRWAVYVATDKPGGPALMTASERAKSLGAELFIQEIGCDREHTPGVNAEDGHEHAAGAHFETEADAKRFAAAFSPAPVWVGQVKTFCLDGGEGP